MDHLGNEKVFPSSTTNPMGGLMRERTFEVPSNRSNNNNKPLGLHRLRYQLASEGCSESQTSLARSLLQERTDNSKDKLENEELAVRWLLMASGEGNQEALDLLRKCYKLGTGITPTNRDRVEKCLKSTAEERIAQQVGQNIFRLMAFDIKEPIPLPYFKLRIASFLSGKEVNDEELESTDEACLQHITVSVEQVISSILKSLNGQEPDIFIDSAIPLKKKFNNKALDFVACKGIRFLFNIESLLRCLSDVLFIHSILIVGVIAALFLILLPTILVDQAQSFIVNATNSWISCSSYVFMIFSSAKMLKLYQVEANILKWIKVIKKFEIKPTITKPSSYTEEIKLLFVQILSTIMFLIYTEKAYEWIISRHLLFLSLIFLVATKPERKMKILYTLHFLIAFVKFLVLPFSYPQWKEFYLFKLNILEYSLCISPISFFGILLLIIHMVIILKLRSKSYILNLSGLLWINIFVGSLSSVTLGSLSSDIMFWALILLGSNKITQITTYGVGLVAENLLSQTVTGSAFGFGAFIFIVLATKVSKYLQVKIGSSKIISFCIVILLMSMLYLTANNQRVTVKPGKEITWPNYALQCHKVAWSESNMAQTQIICDHFKNYKMTVIGSASSIKRIKRDNPMESLIFSLSSSVQRWLLFVFGEDIVSVAIAKLSSCCLNKWNSNQYEIKVELKGTFRVEAELMFWINDICKEFVLSLRESDDVKMTGILIEGMGTDKPTLNLLNGRCLSCVERNNVCNAINVPMDPPSKKNLIINNISGFFLEPFAFIEKK